MAALSRQKRLPKLQSLLAKREPSGKPARQTAQEMRNVLQQLGMKSRPMSEETRKAARFVKFN